MTPVQQSALASLVGRALTEAEIEAIDALLPARRDADIAAILSVGRTRVVQPTFVGDGIVSDRLGLPGGPVFVYLLAQAALSPLPQDHTPEQLAAKAQTWMAWRLLAEGKLDVGLPSVRAGMDAMVGVLPGFTQDMANAIKALAVVDAPLLTGHVSDALNAAED